MCRAYFNAIGSGLLANRSRGIAARRGETSSGLLVVILAWAMMVGPGFDFSYQKLGSGWSTDGEIGFGFAFSTSNGPRHICELSVNRTDALLYPALRLVTFVGWKAAWAIGRRVRATKADR